MLMKSFISVSFLGIWALVASLPAQTAFASSSDSTLEITEVILEFPNPGQITILGANFPDLAKLKVSLGEFGQLNVVAVSPDHTSIVADLPSAIGPGDYILSAYKVKKGPFCENHHSRYCDEFDLTYRAASAQGPQGPQGKIGPAGNTGAAGAQGPQGKIGPAGNDGAAGAAGAQGPQGKIGPAGNNGAAGAQGPQGKIGPAGNNGTDGAQGPQGKIGPAGNTGSTGATGAQGPQGKIGPTGATGVIGNTQVVLSAAAGTFAGSSANFTVSTASSATCPAGKILLGGGAIITQGSNASAAVAISAPTPNGSTGTTPTGWTATAIQLNNTSNGNRPTILAYAVCSQ